MRLLGGAASDLFSRTCRYLCQVLTLRGGRRRPVLRGCLQTPAPQGCAGRTCSGRSCGARLGVGVGAALAVQHAGCTQFARGGSVSGGSHGEGRGLGRPGVAGACCGAAPAGSAPGAGAETVPGWLRARSRLSLPWQLHGPRHRSSDFAKPVAPGAMAARPCHGGVVERVRCVFGRLLMASHAAVSWGRYGASGCWVQPAPAGHAPASGACGAEPGPGSGVAGGEGDRAGSVSRRVSLRGRGRAGGAGCAPGTGCPSGRNVPCREGDPGGAVSVGAASPICRLRAGRGGQAAGGCSAAPWQCRAVGLSPLCPGAGCSLLLQFLPAICGQGSTRRATKPVTSALHL